MTESRINYLPQLDSAVAYLLKQEPVVARIRDLRTALQQSDETFVWAVFDLTTLPAGLPDCIRSGWIFVLKKDIPSGSHFHPNSVQHMVLIEGRGRSHIGGAWQRMVPFGASGHPPEAAWSIIDLGVPHEFFPEGGDMVVVSFHTCPAEELEEISTQSGHQRRYC
jgi:mannose-6-phosphate isomerase-like protein (cupin superfamily)